MSGVIKALALFAVVCGVVFLVFSDSTPTAERGEGAEPTPLERALSSLESIQRAKQSVAAANYGDVSRELTKVEAQLTKIIAGLSSDGAGPHRYESPQ